LLYIENGLKDTYFPRDILQALFNEDQTEKKLIKKKGNCSDLFYNQSTEQLNYFYPNFDTNSISKIKIKIHFFFFNLILKKIIIFLLLSYIRQNNSYSI